MENSYAMFQIREAVGRSQIFFKIGVLKISQISQEKSLLDSLFKKRLQHRCFPVKLAELLRTPFSTEHLW